MTTQDKTQTVTVRVQVPTFSAGEAARKYMPLILDAVEKIEMPSESANAKAVGLRIKGVTIGSAR